MFFVKQDEIVSPRGDRRPSKVQASGRRLSHRKPDPPGLAQIQPACRGNKISSCCMRQVENLPPRGKAQRRATASGPEGRVLASDRRSPSRSAGMADMARAAGCRAVA